MDPIFISKSWTKHNKIDLFPKRMLIRNEKWVTYDKIVQKG